MEKLVLTSKESDYVPMTIRIGADLQEKYTKLAAKTNRSRNEVIEIALKYALEHMELKDEQ